MAYLNGSGGLRKGWLLVVPMSPRSHGEIDLHSMGRRVRVLRPRVVLSPTY